MLKKQKKNIREQAVKIREWELSKNETSESKEWKELRDGSFPQQLIFFSAITGWEGLRGGRICRARRPRGARSRYIVLCSSYGWKVAISNTSTAVGDSFFGWYQFVFQLYEAYKRLSGSNDWYVCWYVGWFPWEGRGFDSPHDGIFLLYVSTGWHERSFSWLKGRCFELRILPEGCFCVWICCFQVSLQGWHNLHVSFLRWCTCRLYFYCHWYVFVAIIETY